LFIHQIEINDYTTKDGMHDLKMNVYWPAVKSFYDIAIRNGLDPTDETLTASVIRENKAREHCIPPRRPTILTLKELDDINWIDKQSFQSLLSLWRNAPVGHPMFVKGPVSDYYAARMAYLRNIEPDNGVSASKSIGW